MDLHLEEEVVEGAEEARTLQEVAVGEGGLSRKEEEEAVVQAGLIQGEGWMLEQGAGAGAGVAAQMEYW